VIPERHVKFVFASTLNPESVIFAATALIALSGLAGLIIRPAPLGQKLATLITIPASAAGFCAAVLMLLSQGHASYVLDWSLPFGSCEIGLDPLSSFFLLPVFLVTCCGSLYGLGYWPAARHRATAPGVTFFYGLLASSMAMVVMARNGALLLISWEIMALSAFFLIVTDQTDREVRRAGMVYLLTTHTGSAALIILFSLLNAATGSFLFPPQGTLAVSGQTASLMFLLALFGFGAKAGIMPMHFWLPSAHANAPSHASALMSGVMLKMGIYGILRFLTFCPQMPLWWGGTLLTAGLVSALLGICFAAVQTDIKRLLAYSSIENIGIITTGIGMALIGEATATPSLVLLGLSGGLLHLLNHSLFKPLLFFGAGGIIHSTGTRVISRMGGVAKGMGTSALLFFIGSLAISGLPPLNGFAGEFLLYIGFFREALAPIPVLALGVPALGLVGGMAAITFVKLYGTVYLGTPRSEQAASPHELPGVMLFPMGVMAFLCIVGGIVPALFLNLVLPVVTMLTSDAASGALLPHSFTLFPLFGAALVVSAAVIWLMIRGALNRRGIEESGTWGCGYAAPTPRMQYTGASFSEFWAGLTRSLSRCSMRKPAPAGIAPLEATFFYEPEETLLERIIRPVLELTGIGCAFLRRLQHGQLHLYVLYIFITLILLMAWVR
jgi:hydrogenase-4 component B